MLWSLLYHSYISYTNRLAADDMSVLGEAVRVNDYFFVVGIDTDSLPPLPSEAQDEKDDRDCHPLCLRYQYVHKNLYFTYRF